SGWLDETAIGAFGAPQIVSSKRVETHVTFRFFGALRCIGRIGGRFDRVSSDAGERGLRRVQRSVGLALRLLRGADRQSLQSLLPPRDCAGARPSPPTHGRCPPC